MTQIEIDIAIVLVAVFVILVGLYMFNRYMKRRTPEFAQREGKAVLDDRSYNQIRIGQAAAERLGRTGVDVSAAKALLDRAEAARSAGNYEMSIELAKKAQDSLAAARAGANPLPTAAAAGPASSPVPSRAPSASSPGNRASTPAAYTAPPTVPFIAGEAAAPPEGAGPPEGPSNRPPKNKMEAHFQIELAQDELEQVRTTKSSTKGFREADILWTNAQKAYDKQDFTEALRLALKSRRTLGARVEALPVSTVPSTTSPAKAEVAGRDPGSLTDQPTFGQKCPQCGRIAAPSDQFCRGCGTAIAPALCSNCGAPLLMGDRYCGKCGATQN
jgi:hypothetical protein